MRGRTIKLSKLFTDFFESEKSGGIILLICTVASLLLSNTTATQSAYLGIWNIHAGGHELTHWINDGLMAIFFLMIGLELEREVYIGELSNLKTALLPAVAALGGMLVPAAIHLACNYNTPYSSGAGIPMATDIAFALGVLSLLGNGVPPSMKIFLTALAVIDDLGAIITIALFYSKGLAWGYLGAALGIFAVLGICNRLKVNVLLPYLIGGMAMWWCMLHSGVHATLSGVLLAFVIPFGTGSEDSISYKLQHFLHRPVSFGILPIFALANTAIVLGNASANTLFTTNNLGIAAGLLLGKPLGIISFSFIAIYLKLCAKPRELKWINIAGLGLLGGIGFTMSIFVTLLAFSNSTIVDASKIAIITASALSALSGLVLLHFTLPRPQA